MRATEDDQSNVREWVESAASRLLYRAVGLNEARDIEAGSRSRLDPRSGYQDGKWFAARVDDAVRWGRAMQRFPDPRPFRIAVASVPEVVAATFAFHERWDAIGPAYYVRWHQLDLLNRSAIITVFDEMYDPKDPL